jgi:hypothetical protein
MDHAPVPGVYRTPADSGAIVNSVRRRCPVCWRRVRPMINQVIEGHWDSAGHDVCPGSYEPYRITLGQKPTLQEMAA